MSSSTSTNSSVWIGPTTAASSALAGTPRKAAAGAASRVSAIAMPDNQHHPGPIRPPVAAGHHAHRLQPGQAHGREGGADEEDGSHEGGGGEGLLDGAAAGGVADQPRDRQTGQHPAQQPVLDDVVVLDGPMHLAPPEGNGAQPAGSVQAERGDRLAHRQVAAHHGIQQPAEAPPRPGPGAAGPSASAAGERQRLRRPQAMPAPARTPNSSGPIHGNWPVAACSAAYTTASQLPSASAWAAGSRTLAGHGERIRILPARQHLSG